MCFAVRCLDSKVLLFVGRFSFWFMVAVVKITLGLNLRDCGLRLRVLCW